MACYTDCLFYTQCKGCSQRSCIKWNREKNKCKWNMEKKTLNEINKTENIKRRKKKQQLLELPKYIPLIPLEKLVDLDFLYNKPTTIIVEEIYLEDIQKLPTNIKERMIVKIHYTKLLSFFENLIYNG